MLKVYHVLADHDPVGGARNAAKISVALRELDEPYDVQDMSRIRDLRPLDSDYRKRINPNGLVPAIDDEGFILWESVAVLRYLAETRPNGSKLLPVDPKKRAIVQQWLSWEAEDYNADLVNLFYLATPEAADDPAAFPTVIQGDHSDGKALKVGQEKYRRKLRILDAALVGKDYVAGDFSIADIALGNHVVLSANMQMSLKGFPNIDAWMHRLANRPSFQQEKCFITDYNNGCKAGLI